MNEMNSQNEIDSRSNEREIERYLYLEMSDEERAAMEARFFDDDRLFYEVLHLENELIDSYVSGKLGGSKLARFERALENLPERRAKIANAAALQTYIADERLPEKIIAAVETKRTFGQRLAQLLSVKTPAFAYATAGMLLIFALSSGFLLLDNRRKADELARLQSAETLDLQQREKDLRSRLNDARDRESELKTRIDDERATSGDLTDELDRERERRERIEADLERLRRERAVPTPTATAQPQAPVIASITLLPAIGTRGGGGGETATQTFSLERGTKRIAVRIVLPDGAKTTGERFSVALNEKIVARDVAVVISSGGQKAVRLTVSPNDLLDGANKIIVLDAANAEVARYVFNARK